jgi:hypothetical protein
VPIPRRSTVPLSAPGGVERDTRTSPQYASPERYRVRHILVKPAQDDSASRSAPSSRARAPAQAHPARRRGVREGAPSEDRRRAVALATAATSAIRGAGELDPVLQSAAFALNVGRPATSFADIDGYHILQVTEHLPEQAEPSPWVYTAVGFDEALEKGAAHRAARPRTASRRSFARPRRRSGSRSSWDFSHAVPHTPGRPNYPPELLHMALLLESLKPGEMYPGIRDVPRSGRRGDVGRQHRARRASSTWEEAQAHRRPGVPRQHESRR